MARSHLEVLEGLFHAHELEIVAPELCRIVLGQVGAQEITPLALAHLAQFLAIEADAEGGLFGIDIDVDRAPGSVGTLARSAELHQKLLAGELHCHELLEPCP